jgi:predicted enzyme related to lactoylglutathione lyase
VRDVAATTARIVELGGAVVESSRTLIDFGGTPLEFVYCTDPDGVRVELMDLGS